MTRPAPTVTVPVDKLAQEIRRVDGNHDLGAGALAEALAPFLSSMLAVAPAAPQAAGVGELDWSRFKEMCEQKLATALKADFGDAPFPMDANEAASYHRTRADLLGWVLDMWPTTPLSLRAPSREPEGGAVWGAAIEAAANTVERQIPDAAGGPTSHTNTARVFMFDAVKAIRALATREEAPAEAGWMARLTSALEQRRYADVAVLPDDLRAALSALRAQPQPRSGEDQ